jgi:isopentenyl-diphosphate delta-isomerase
MEQVILVDVNDGEVGTMEKMEAHEKARLHRAFSVFIFNEQGEMLLQQRALTKYHSGGLWTNACCSHPRPGETTFDAANRRLQEELGFSTSLTKAFDFTYNAPFANGLTEHEFDHVFVGTYSGPMHLNFAEVENISYRSIHHIASALATQPTQYTVWFHLAFPKMLSWLQTRAL